MITVVGRKLVIPEKESQIGTTYDNDSEVRYIRINRITTGGVDLSNLRFKLDLKYEDAILDTCLLDIEVQENYILLTWNIPAACVSHKGTVWIAVRAYDENGTIKWATNPGAVYVGHTIFDGDAYKGHLAEFEQLEERITQKAETLDVDESERQEAEKQRKANEERRVNNEAEWQRQAETAITEANTTLEKATEKADTAKREADTATTKAKEASDSAEAAGLSKDKAEMAANTAVTKAQEVQTNVDAAVELKELSLQAAITATDKAAESNASAERAESSTTLILQAEATVTKTAEQVKADAKTAADSRDIAVSEATKATEKASQADVSAKEVQRIVEGLGGFDGTAEHVSAVDTQGININTATGTTQVTVSDAWEAPIPGLEIAGKSEQGADPSPDNPQEIVSTDVTAVTVTGANLLDMSGANSGTSEGITVTVNKGGYYTYSGTARSDNINMWLFGSYTDGLPELFRLKKGIYYKRGMRLFNGRKSVGPIDDGEFILGEDTPITGVRALQLVNGNTYNNVIAYPMLNHGTNALPWEPYQSKTAAITLTEPLRGIGDVRDRIMCRNGMWGVERAINQIDDTGTVPISEALEVLTTPTWVPLPSATQSALNALTTYTGQTTITVTADGPEPDITMQYYGQPGAKTNVQSMLDSLARKVALELVSNSDLAQLLSGYLAKSCIKNTGLVTEEGFVADARQLNPEIADTLAARVKKNAEDIVTANSNLASIGTGTQLAALSMDNKTMTGISFKNYKTIEIMVIIQQTSNGNMFFNFTLVPLVSHILNETRYIAIPGKSYGYCANVLLSINYSAGTVTLMEVDVNTGFTLNAIYILGLK